MSYVNYNYELYRQGFRPYGETDPFSASMLNGVDAAAELGYYPSESRGPMGPWELHGIGQTHPFTERGGWPLHGLAGLGIVPDQSIVLYQGRWQSTYTMGATDIIAAVSAALASNGAVAVRNASSDAGVLQSTVVGMTIQPGPFNVTLQLQVTNGQGFGQPSDIASIVDHFVYQITGSMPLTSSIPSVQAPGGDVTATGQPGIVGAPSASGAIDWGTWFQQNALWVGLGVGALVLLPKILR